MKDFTITLSDGTAVVVSLASVSNIAYQLGQGRFFTVTGSTDGGTTILEMTINPAHVVSVHSAV